MRGQCSQLYHIFQTYFLFSASSTNLSKALSKILFRLHECAPCTSLNYTVKSSTARTKLLKFLTAFVLSKVYPPPKKKTTLFIRCFSFAICFYVISCNSLEIFTISPVVTVYHSNLMNFVASK